MNIKINIQGKQVWNIFWAGSEFCAFDSWIATLQ